MSAISYARTAMRCAICAPARASLTLNCGYGHGFSVREVVEAVKRVSGVDFKVENAPRRPGDAARIVADSAQLRGTLDWRPRFDDLSTIVGHALAWERELMVRRTRPSGQTSECERAASRRRNRNARHRPAAPPPRSRA